jgi:hypothetical protein
MQPNINTVFAWLVPLIVFSAITFILGFVYGKFKVRKDSSIGVADNPNTTSNNKTINSGVNCSNCGAEITPKGAKFCKHCGTKVEQIITTSTTVKAEAIKPPTIEKKIVDEVVIDKPDDVATQHETNKKIEKPLVHKDIKPFSKNNPSKELLILLSIFAIIFIVVFSNSGKVKTDVKDESTYYGTFAYDNGDIYEGQLKDGRPTWKKGYQLKYKYSTSFIAPNSKIHQEVKRIRPNINCLAIYKGTNFNAHDAYICEQDFKNKIALKVKKHWRYQGAKKDWGCDVHILQDIDGNVQSVNVQSCVVDNSAESKSFKNSIERAVYKASPLPLSPNSVFTSWSEEQILLHGISLETAFQTKFYFKVD